MEPRPPSPDLIADIFDAAIDDARWPDFATLVGKATKIEHMGVWMVEDGRIVDMALADIWRSLGEVYKERFSRIDPWAGSLVRAPLETVMLGYEHLREDELVKTEFYNDFARPGGMFRPMGVRMQLAPGVFSTIGSDLPWGRKRLEASDKPRLRQVIPYVKRALQLRRRWRNSQGRARSQAAALDALAFAAIVCDADGRVAFANAAAAALAGGGAGISFGRRGLQACVPGETRALARLVRDAASGGAGGAIRLTGRDGTTAVLVLVTPLPRGLNGDHAAAHALVCLRSARDSAPFTQALVASLLELSPAQAAIALAIYDGRSPEEIAAERNVAISTVRTHLAEIFARTGAENQRDLVRLLGMLPPVRSGTAADGV
jgi:DNA-binding CsgD family transcriptional regulator/PAS domain-containing protein